MAQLKQLSRKAWVYITIGALILITAVTLWSAQSFKTTAQAAAEAKPPASSTITARVTSEKLRTTTALRCTASYATTKALNYAGHGTQYTAIHVKSGQEITNGTLIAEVNGAPLYAITGSFSFYRDLSMGDTGPDAAMLNTALTNLGRMNSTAGEITEDTYRALNSMFYLDGYGPIDSESPIPADYFTVLSAPAKVAGTPRGPGAVSEGSIADLVEGAKSVQCTSPAGTLTPEAKSGQKVTIPALGDEEYVGTLISHESKSGQGGSAGSAAQSERSAAGSSSTQPERYMLVNVGEKAEKLTTSVTGELILEETPEPQTVVPAAALFTKDGKTHVIRIRDGKDEEIQVRVLINSSGKNSVSGDIHPGDTVKIVRESRK
ncbi:MAG: secretion protein HlyD [Rothia sp. (in: high G+C Gram-positive bacteria)]|uniref:secretion protein HlyD n=1 Tax=Rothia sp. (in: high G+C Gram-positive bacteria) TaxID=1885016 RepID=UPI0026DEE9A6|nr:secretion protein HlyD [Rothia sp. (in: high G+C Gram-positive bacteria)]MDO5749684.1 secretion protein HlyD [Rothia sp. (in: high G+C Gram-positive bacteria)]